MILKLGNIEFRHNKKDNDMKTQNAHIHSLPKIDTEKIQTSTEEGKIVKGATTTIKTYFIWKMADRVLEKVIR